jgi:hypothetical protein
MWLSDYLLKMIQIYDKMDAVDEIIIIDNAPTKQIKLDSPKVKIITKGQNIYVNPAWNLGVLNSKNNHIIIANDDLLFDEADLFNLINISVPYLKDNVVIGPSMHCFKHMGVIKDGLKITKHVDAFTFGFGTFMIMKKTSYTIIPDDILIFHGDVIQHKTNDIYLFSGIEILTPMSTTLKSDEKIHALARLDHAKSLKYNIKTLKKIN